MCIKHVGVELPLMVGAKPQVTICLAYRGEALYKLALKKDQLSAPLAELPIEFEEVLALDKRERGDRRPLRLVLGKTDRSPYHFYSACVPDGGMPIPDGTLSGNLALELWVDSPQPLWPYPALFHLKGSDPVVHPFGRRVLWVCHKHWTDAWQLGGYITQHDESPCGCCTRTRMEFRDYRTLEAITLCH